MVTIQVDRTLNPSRLNLHKCVVLVEPLETDSTNSIALESSEEKLLGKKLVTRIFQHVMEGEVEYKERKINRRSLILIHPPEAHRYVVLDSSLQFESPLALLLT